MWIFPRLSYFIIQCQVITFVNITIDLIKSPLSIWKLSSSQWQIHIFPNSDFSWKLKFYHWQQILADVFPEVTSSLGSFLRKCLPKAQDWITMVCLSLILSGKNDGPGKKQIVQLTTQTITRVLFLKTTIVLPSAAEVLYAYVCHTEH